MTPTLPRSLPLLALVGALALAGAAPAAEIEREIENPRFAHEGPFGTYDRMQLQRGAQVYQEVCAACHGMKYVSFRSFGQETGPALPPEQIKALAEMYEVVDKETGETRPGRPSDNMPPNDAAGAPDLSLMAKSRAGFYGPMGLGLNQLFKGTGGPEYIYSLMVGYRDEPECAADAGMDGYYNVAFGAGGFPESCKDEHGHHMVPGSWIAMPPPLSEGQVEYVVHGSDEMVPPAATVEQMSEDVSAFLMWAAEPHMTDRKSAGLRNLLLLAILAVLLYYTNKWIWASVKGKDV